jgi:TIR domain
MPDRKPRLFLSHASEQKDAVVIPLDSLLADECETWYDKKDIPPKGSLFSSISDALNWCDYAVLIISQEFINKEWTKAELRGAWTIQIERKRSVIIPVRYNVTQSDVIKLSPMLADIPAIVSIDPRVISGEIRLAVGVGEQAREQYGPLSEARKQVTETLAMEQAFNQIAHTPEGVARFKQTWENIKRLCETEVSSFGDPSPFRLHESGPSYPPFIAVNSPPIEVDNFNRTQLRFQLHNIASNTIYRSKMTRRVLLINSDPLEQVHAHLVSDDAFEVYCDPEKNLIWRDKDRKLWMTKTIVEEGLKLLYDRTNDAKNGRPFRHFAC